MGWTEEEYYTSSPYMFFAACEGYFDKLEDYERPMRNLAGIVNRSMGGKENMQEVWPLHNDPKPGIITTWTDEELKEMTARHNEVFAKLNKK